jgi:hypothetical protein
MTSMHKHILVGLIVGILAYHFWMRRAGSGGNSPEGG